MKTIGQLLKTLDDGTIVKIYRSRKNFIAGAEVTAHWTFIVSKERHISSEIKESRYYMATLCNAKIPSVNIFLAI